MAATQGSAHASDNKLRTGTTTPLPKIRILIDPTLILHRQQRYWIAVINGNSSCQFGNARDPAARP
jgi:hypothetical protein